MVDQILDDPEDTRGLLRLISLIIEEVGPDMQDEEFPPEITKNLGKIDRVLRSQLKGNHIKV